MNANKWVARVDFEKEDQFLLLVFVTRLKEEIHYEVQILVLARRPSSLVLMMINSCSYVY